MPMRGRSTTGAAEPEVTVVARARSNLDLAAAAAELRVIAS
jgi:hypothetical protein